MQVSVIGDGFASTTDPDHAPLTAADAILAQATRPGLVRFDASGQVIPALGENWITTADGLSTVFRLRDRHWPGGASLTGPEVAARFETATGARSRNALKPLLTAVDGVVGMTDRVVEIRLKVPRPNLLQLLAQPELGIARSGAGLSGWRTERIDRARFRLHSEVRETGTASVASEAAPPVELRAERASLAVARFVAGRTDLVLGGTIADWPIVSVANVRSGRLRFDPARGLLGIAIVGQGSFLRDARNREALAMAIDRSSLATMLGLPAWDIREQLLPDQLDSARPPARPGWSALNQTARRDEAGRRVAAWTRAATPAPTPATTLTIAVPDRPGWRVVLARLTADWRAIGVSLERARPGTVPDLRVIDAVAPNASANWFLSVTACEAGLACDAAGDAALDASRGAATLAERSLAIAAADDASAARASFIILGAPIRWLLVDPSLTRFRENAAAVHPLDQLRPMR